MVRTLLQKYSKVVLIAVLMIAAFAAVCPADMFPLPGEWPCERRNETRNSYSPLKGDIKQPQIVWKHFIGVVETFLIAEPGGAKSDLTIPVGSEVGKLSVVDDRDHWRMPPLTGLIGGRVQEYQASATVAYGEIFADCPGMEKIVCESSFNLPTIKGRWSNGKCRCYKFQDGEWVEVWQTEKFRMFRPRPIIGDFDADGEPEMAMVPWGSLRIYDARTGAKEDQVDFTKGRSYGFFGAYDLNNDGKQEFVVQADFAKHVDVLGYKNGKLSLLWQHNIELVIANPMKIMWVHPDPVADVDGDGKSEVLMNLYNDTGDLRWHLLILDGMKGTIKADLVDEYMQGKLDVDGDGAVELLTVAVKGSGLPEYGTIRVRSLKTGQPETLWELDDAAWQTWDVTPTPNVNTGARLGTRDVMSRATKSGKHVVLRQRIDGDPEMVRVSVATWKDGKFNIGATVNGPRMDVVGLDAGGNLLLRCVTNPQTEGRVKGEYCHLQILGSRDTGAPTATVAVAWEKDCRQATVIAQGFGEQLVALRPPTEQHSAQERWRIHGRGQSWGWPEVNGPVIADLKGDGSRQVIYATASETGAGRLVAADLDGREIWRHDFPRIPGKVPIWNRGGVLQWQVGHFNSKNSGDVLVTIRRSMMHSEELVLLSGRDGSRRWHRKRLLGYRSVAGPFAIADFDGDGKNEVFFASRLMRGLVRADGSLVWFHDDTMDHCPHNVPVFGDIDGDGKVEAIDIGYADGIHCYDVMTGREKWRFGAVRSGSGAAVCDIDSDGRDEVIFVTGGRTIVCIGADRDGKAGKVEWELEMPTNVGPITVADVDGSQRASILVTGEAGISSWRAMV